MKYVLNQCYEGERGTEDHFDAKSDAEAIKYAKKRNRQLGGTYFLTLKRVVVVKEEKTIWAN